jgi:peroxiredoxin
MQSVKVDRFLRIGMCLLAAALVYTIYAGIHQRVIAAGDSAPDFAVTADNGQAVSLPDFRGKLLVLNFWASWCPPCVEETPSLSQFAADYASRGVVVLGLSVDRDEKAYQGFLQRFRPAFLTARESRLHEEFGTYLYPETYIIDANARVLKKIAGEADWNDPNLRRYIDSLL